MLTKEQWKAWLDYRANFNVYNEGDEPVSYLEVVAELFGIITYDSGADRTMASWIVEVLVSIANGKTFQYHSQSDEHYLRYLTVINLREIVDLLSWGTSVRGAWLNPPNEGWNLERYLGTEWPPVGLRPVLKTREEMTSFVQILSELINEQETSLMVSVNEKSNE